MSPQIIAAPIGSVATTDLVSAVSNAGGVGSLGASWTSIPELRVKIEIIRTRTDRPFAVNLVNAFEQSERVALCEELRVPIVSFSWGVSPNFIAQLRSAGIQVWQQVHNESGAEKALGAGATALIAQNVEAGGHVEGVALGLSLLQRVSGAVPVFAAGGIGSEEQAVHAVQAGAAGVVLGTRFVASSEADAHDCWKDGIVRAEINDTYHGIVFDRGWPDAPHRVLRNSTVRLWELSGSPLPSEPRPGDADIVARTNAYEHVRYADDVPLRETTGNPEALAMYAGTSSASIHSVEPAADIVARFAAALSR
jgi:nitronate monooxygenase